LGSGGTSRGETERGHDGQRQRRLRYIWHRPTCHLLVELQLGPVVAGSPSQVRSIGGRVPLWESETRIASWMRPMDSLPLRNVSWRAQPRHLWSLRHPQKQATRLRDGLAVGSLPLLLCQFVTHTPGPER